jgi:hypothetical protein
MDTTAYETTITIWNGIDKNKPGVYICQSCGIVSNKEHNSYYDSQGCVSTNYEKTHNWQYFARLYVNLKERAMSTNLKNLLGQVFGQWKVLSRADNNRAGAAYWLCECSCGTKRAVSGIELRRGASKSCGTCSQRSKL